MSHYFIFCIGLVIGGAISGDKDRAGLVVGVIGSILGIVYAVGYAVAIYQ